MTDYLRTAVWLALLTLGIALSAIQLTSDEHHRSHLSHAGHGHGDHHRPQRLFSWEPEQAHTLTLRLADGREQRFVRSSGEWHGPAPLAEDSALDPAAYLALLSQARKDREFHPQPDTLNLFDLEPAVLQIRVEGDADAVLAELFIGARTPDGFGRYVRMPTDSRVLIIPNYQFEAALNAFP